MGNSVSRVTALRLDLARAIAAGDNNRAYEIRARIRTLSGHAPEPVTLSSRRELAPVLTAAYYTERY